MKFQFTIIIVFICALSGAQTREYSGIVRLKNDKSPIPGVNVIVKGTQIVTQTDLDGLFKITVPDSLNILSFSFVGIETKEVKLDESEFLEIFLKEECHVDWFDSNQFGVFVNSGVLNNPVGGEIQFSFPHFMGEPLLKTGIGYQTNFNKNRFFNAYLNLEHLLVSCNFSLDLGSSIRNLNYDNNIDSNSYSLESSLNFPRIKVIVGFSNVDYNETNKGKIVRSNGPLIGLGTWIGPPFLLSVNAKTSIYKDLNEYQVELKRNFKRISSFIRFNRIGNFNELSLGLGYEFNYYLKKRHI